MRVFKHRYGSKGETKETKNWYVEITDHNGTRRRIPGYAEKKLTREMGETVERLVDLRSMNRPPSPDLARWIESISSDLRNRLAKWDIIDSKAVAFSKPIMEHLDDFHQSILDDNRTADHANLVKARVGAILDGCRFAFFTDISASKVKTFLKKQREKKKGGISHQTSNHYLASFKQFCRWMVDDRRATENPVNHLDGLELKKNDIRHPRRSLSESEMAALLKATACGPVRHRVDGRSRAMLYRVAMETGFRRDELRVITPASIKFDDAIPFIFLSDSDTKNGKEAQQAIRLELAAELRDWIKEAGILASDPLWPNLTQNTALMLRKDLKAAGIPYVDDSGRYADFHALRHSFITHIAKGNQNVKVAQRLARHSDVNLTLGRYTHLLLTDEAEGLKALPELPSIFGEPNQEIAETLGATGTDDATAEKTLPLFLPISGSEQCRSMPKKGDSGTVGKSEPSPKTKHKKSLKPLENKVFQADSKSGERGIRTLGTREGTPVFETGNASTQEESRKGFTSGVCVTLPQILPISETADPDLERLAAAWPGLSDDVKRQILKHANLS